MKGKPLVSVIISNYNYGHFLCEVIDSALNQTYSNTEIIVVDDGSTDDSQEVMTSYGDRIIPVLKKNGGQSSALNMGFSVSKGEIVIFFDADDVLLPDTTRLVVSAFQAGSNTARVQYRMEIVDVHGNLTGRLLPPSHRHMLNGDLRQHVLKFGDHFWPPTSGHAFTSTLLRRILPIPEDLYRNTPDIYLNGLSVMFGPIVSLDEVGALYRAHEQGSYQAAARELNLSLLRKLILAGEYSRVKQRELFNTLYSVNVRRVGYLDLHSLRDRMISLKLDPLNHPLNDNLLSLCIRGCISSMVPDGQWQRLERFVHALWFVAVLFAPKAFAKSLTETLFYRREGGVVNRLLPIVRRVR